jgi:hypothetical protein
MIAFKAVLLIGCLLLTPGLAGKMLMAEEMPVPPGMQASLFKKIFGYDKKLSTLTELKIVVAYAEASAASKDELVKAFQDVGISAIALKADQVAANLGDTSAVYIASGAASAESVCRKNHILSITGIPSLVENGTAAIGLGVVEGKPKILVHLGKLRAEGHEVSAKLLQLARVIE